MGDGVGRADVVEGVAPGALSACAPAGAAEAVGELAAIVGEDGVDRMAEGGEEALERGRDGVGATVAEYFDMDEAGGTLDDDKDIGGYAGEPGQVLEIGMDIAERRRLEPLVPGSRCGDWWQAGHAVAVPQAMQSGTRDIGPQAAAHDLQRIVERKPQAATQFDRDGFFLGGKGGGETMRCRCGRRNRVACASAGPSST